MGEKKEVMIMMKKFLALLLSVCLLAALCAGCGSTQTTAEDPATDETTTAGTEDPVTIRLGGLKGPTSMGMVKLLSDNDAGTTTNHYAFTMAGSADELTPKMLQGELDILAVPVNLGSVLYNNSEGSVQLLAVNTLGVIYIVEKGGQTVTDWESLRGQTIYATGKGSTPEYALNYLLEETVWIPPQMLPLNGRANPRKLWHRWRQRTMWLPCSPSPLLQWPRTSSPICRSP